MLERVGGIGARTENMMNDEKYINVVIGVRMGENGRFGPPAF